MENGGQGPLASGRPSGRRSLDSPPKTVPSPVPAVGDVPDPPKVAGPKGTDGLADDGLRRQGVVLEVLEKPVRQAGQDKEDGVPHLRAQAERTAARPRPGRVEVTGKRLVPVVGPGPRKVEVGRVGKGPDEPRVEGRLLARAGHTVHRDGGLTAALLGGVGAPQGPAPCRVSARDASPAVVDPAARADRPGRVPVAVAQVGRRTGVTPTGLGRPDADSQVGLYYTTSSRLGTFFNASDSRDGDQTRGHTTGGGSGTGSPTRGSTYSGGRS